MQCNIYSHIWHLIIKLKHTNYSHTHNIAHVHWEPWKGVTFIFACTNFDKCEPISIILSLLYSRMKFGRRQNKICNRASNLLAHYLAKFECSTVITVRRTLLTVYWWKGDLCSFISPATVSTLQSFYKLCSFCTNSYTDEHSNFAR